MGHGHVIRRQDGTRKQCGGPYVCRECAMEMRHVTERRRGGLLRSIAFLWTTAPLLAGAKTVTRRDWEPEYAAHFRAGMHLLAVDKRLEWGGMQLGVIELTHDPYREHVSLMPEEDFAGEGFAWLEEHPELKPKKFQGMMMRDQWNRWRYSDSTETVIRFRWLDQYVELDAWVKLRHQGKRRRQMTEDKGQARRGGPDNQLQLTI